MHNHPMGNQFRNEKGLVRAGVNYRWEKHGDTIQ
jgi:hypothetical protein